MALFWTSGLSYTVGFLIFLIILNPVSMEEAYDSDLSSSLNCTTIDNVASFHQTNTSQLDKSKLSHYINLRNDQHFNKYFDDQPQNKYLNNRRSNMYSEKEQINKYSDEKHINTQIVDQQLKNLHEQTFEKQPLNAHLIDQPHNRDSNEENLKVRPLNNHHNDQNLKKHVNDELNRFIANKQLIKITDNQENKEQVNDQLLNGNFYDKYSNSYSEDQYKNQHVNIKNQHVHINYRDNQNLNGYNDNIHLNRSIIDSFLDTYSEDQNLKNYADDLQTNRRLNIYNTTKKIQKADKNFNNKHFEEHLYDEPFNKHHVKWESNIPIDNQSFENYLIEQNHDIHLNNQQVKENFYDKSRNSTQFEEQLIEQNLERRLDDLHPYRRLKNQNFERRLVDQLIDKHLTDNVHLNKRLNDENYDRYEVNNNFDKQKNDRHSNDVLNEMRSNRRLIEQKIFNDDTTTIPRNESNISHLMTFTMLKDWEESVPKLNFPKKLGYEKIRITTLHLDQGLFIFDFLRSFLTIIQPRNIPLDLLKETLEGQVKISTLIKQSIHIEMSFIAVMSIFVLLMFIVPGTELWLCCRSNKYSYQQHKRGTKLLFLSIFALIIGMCVMTMLFCNEEVAGGIEMIPDTIEAALQDFKHYHAGTAVQLRKCVTRSLDVASEAILTDLDNVEELLGKPVQELLSFETQVDVVLDTLMDVANASQELAYKTNVVLQQAEKAREFSNELSHEVDEIRHDLEKMTRDCAMEDRSLCAVLDPSGLHLAIRLDKVARDDRLLRLKIAGRDNLMESGRQARGEYLSVPHYVSRTTLEARNQIRREVSMARAKVSDDARSIEASSSDISDQLEKIKQLSNQIVPYINNFEYTRWFIGFGIALCVLLIWLLLFGALCCRCVSSENKARPTLLWFVFLSIFVSIVLWLVLMAALAIASHIEMMLCRPLDDPEYRTIETIIETKAFLGKRLNIPLKDIFEKCKETDAAYPAFQLDNIQKLEQLTAHWTWSELSRATSKLKVDLSGLRILSPNLRERLQNLLYASGPNLTEHRIMIQGPILNKDLNALSEQVENVARQITDRRMAGNFQTLAAQMRELLSRRVKPLMKMQDELVYQLASLELHIQPLQRQINQSLTHLLNIQYYIDNQGEKIGQLKTKTYIQRLNIFLEQWRTHVLTEMNSKVSKCRPLWDILRGIKLLFCSHILGPLNGFWFATLICVLTMLVSTPTAHNLAFSYWLQPRNKGSVLLSSRQGSPDTVIMDREIWRTPDPPPSVDSW